jgi:DNA helicase HerA-like ATPase
MTGAGKSSTARRIIEQLAEKSYPIVIFDPHGDYTGLADLPKLQRRVSRYHAQFPVFEEDSETVADIVNNLGYELSPTMRTLFGDVVGAAKAFYSPDQSEMEQRAAWLAGRINRPQLLEHRVQPDMWLTARMAEAGELVKRANDQAEIQQLEGWSGFGSYSRNDIRTLEAIKKRAYTAASALTRMEQTNRKIAGISLPLPTDRTELVRYGQISVVSLAGYTGDFQATLYGIVAESIFNARVAGVLELPVLFVLEEAHNFAPSHAASPAERRAVTTTKQIAQEGRKFNVGLILISQRPSSLDETTLAMCNSYVVMRMVNPADQSYVRRVIESLGEDDARMLPDLDVGEALLSGQFVNFPILVRMKLPESTGEHEEQDAFEALEDARKQRNTSHT